MEGLCTVLDVAFAFKAETGNIGHAEITIINVIDLFAPNHRNCKPYTFSFFFVHCHKFSTHVLQT